MGWKGVKAQVVANEKPSQEQIWQRWGAPQEDPKYRQGRLMIAGIRLGDTFVGIQPARGYNQDLSANYHDPDLVPPHSYLAFYWVAICFFRLFNWS